MKRFVASFVVLTSVMATAALAEPETGSRLGKNTRSGPQMTEEQANIAAQAMANCLVMKRSNAAERYLLSRDEDQAEGIVTGLMRTVSCLGGGPAMTHLSDMRQVTFPTDVLRGKLAEALLANDRSAVAALQPAKLERQYIRPWYPLTTRNSYIDEMAICVVETNPQGVWSMLSAKPETKEEGTAFRAIVPNMGQCLRAGANLTANRQALRAAMAEAMWQRLHAPAVEQVNPPEEKGK